MIFHVLFICNARFWTLLHLEFMQQRYVLLLSLPLRLGVLGAAGHCLTSCHLKFSAMFFLTYLMCLFNYLLAQFAKAFAKASAVILTTAKLSGR